MEAGLVYLKGFSYAEWWDYLIEVNTSDGSARIIREYWVSGDGLNESTDYQPSLQDHNGRWFAGTLQAPENGEYPPSSTYPDGATCRVICAILENGEPVNLTPDPLLEPLLHKRPRWVADDSEIWFLARRRDVDGEMVPGSLGFYRMGVEISGGAIQVVFPPIMVANSPVWEDDSMDFNRVDFDVAPDGSKIIYWDYIGGPEGDRGIFEFDVWAGTNTFVGYGSPYGLDYNVPQYAVVGTQPEALYRHELSDGSYSVLVESGRKSSVGGGAAFSPSGEQVAYVLGKSVRGDYYMSLMFITSDGATDLGDMFTLDKLWVLDWFSD